MHIPEIGYIKDAVINFLEFGSTLPNSYVITQPFFPYSEVVCCLNCYFSFLCVNVLFIGWVDFFLFYLGLYPIFCISG